MLKNSDMALNDPASYEKLLRDYQELQLRVTRFSAVEQQLKNANSQLDQELELHKKLQRYSFKALHVGSEEELLALMAESIIDVLEVEFSFVYVKYNAFPEKSLFKYEGFEYTGSTEFLHNSLPLLAKEKIAAGSYRLTQDDFERYPRLLPLADGVLASFFNEEDGYEWYMFGAISKANRATYPLIEERHVSIFGILANQMYSVYVNQLNTKKIKLQIDRIRQSELELQKLSLIATKTQNNVIITDAWGRIEWVNEAFTATTGWTAQEVFQRKPKDFLQGKDKSDPAIQLMSTMLSLKRPVRTTVKNYTKDGKLFYNQLEILPVYDAESRLTNFISIQKNITDEFHYQRQLETANERFELVLNKVTNDIIWEWDLVLDRVVWGQGLSRLIGRETDKLGSHYYDLFSYLHPDDRQRVLEQVETCLKTQKQGWDLTYRLRSLDGSYRMINDRSHLVLSGENVPIRIIGAMTDETERLNLEQQVLSEKLNKQRLITEATIQAQEKEKNDLGTELHDNISQILAAAKVYLDIYAGQTEAQDTMIHKSHAHVREALHEIRNLSHALATPSLAERSLHAILQDLIEDVTLQQPVRIILDDRLDPHVSVSDMHKLVCYRVIQEQFNNIFKHAQATEVGVLLRLQEGRLFVSVSDNGIGFDAARISDGTGLKNIQSRVALYSGAASIETAPGEGCTLHFNIEL